MKQIVKNFNNFVKNTIFKVKNKTNNKFIISNFNKFLITFISVLFLYIFYLLIPTLYDKNWVKNNIESKLFSEFKININSFSDISYHILPSPHYLVKNSKLKSDKHGDQQFIGDLRILKIFLKQNNFFNRNKIIIKKVNIQEANFNQLKGNLGLLNELSNNQFSNKKVVITKSKIYFRNNLEEIISIINIDKATIYFDEKKLFNIFELKGNVFAVPFSFELNNKNNSIKEKEIKFKVKSLNLNMNNKSLEEKNSLIKGKNVISFLNSKLDTEYENNIESIKFNSNNSKINSSKINYEGKLSINPFDLDLNINLNNFKISKLFNSNIIFIEFLKSELLFHENINLNTSLTINSNTNEDFFHNVQIYFNILNGRMNLDSSKFINKDIGLLELNNSNLLFENNALILNTDILFEIKNQDALFSYLNTNKKLRKEIRNILVNLNYDFLTNQIELNDIKVNNNEVSRQFLNIAEDFKDNNLHNLVKTRRLLNKLLSIYEG